MELEDAYTLLLEVLYSSYPFAQGARAPTA